jgi:hypothetical protein
MPAARPSGRDHGAPLDQELRELAGVRVSSRELSRKRTAPRARSPLPRRVWGGPLQKIPARDVVFRNLTPEDRAWLPVGVAWKPEAISLQWLLNSSTIPKDSVSGLRNLALIAAMFYSFARVSAVLKLKVDDYYHNGARRRLKLHEKGGKERKMPLQICSNRS